MKAAMARIASRPAICDSFSPLSSCTGSTDVPCAVVIDDRALAGGGEEVAHRLIVPTFRTTLTRAWQGLVSSLSLAGKESRKKRLHICGVSANLQADPKHPNLRRSTWQQPRTKPPSRPLTRPSSRPRSEEH